MDDNGIVTSHAAASLVPASTNAAATLVQPSSKNNDCYFYYYSSCTKGAACPFRHEPSALRNETMCIYWLQGTCTKPNCIFRHMEIHRKRDKIACFFESRPGGCKKLHCPFFHQNVGDQPREEDIGRNSGLILPTKGSNDTTGNVGEDVSSTRENNSNMCNNNIISGSMDKLYSLPTSVAPDHPTPVTPSQVVLPHVAFMTTPRSPVIVPLDGESDSESAGTPQKFGYVERQLTAETEWELQRLRQIQADEAEMIGYTFEDDEQPQQPEDDESDEILLEEIIEVEDEEDAANRHFHPNDSQVVTITQYNHYDIPDVQTEEYIVDEEDYNQQVFESSDLRQILNHSESTVTPELTIGRSPLVNRGEIKKPRNSSVEKKLKTADNLTFKLSINRKRLGGIAERALRDTFRESLGIRSSSIRRKSDDREESVKFDRSTRHLKNKRKHSDGNVQNNNNTSSHESYLNVDKRKKVNDDDTVSKRERSSLSRLESKTKPFSVKDGLFKSVRSLVELKSSRPSKTKLNNSNVDNKKNRSTSKECENSNLKSSLHVTDSHNGEGKNIVKIKTLAEIRAEKRKIRFNNDCEVSNSNSKPKPTPKLNPKLKQSKSLIKFTSDSNKKQKREISDKFSKPDTTLTPNIYKPVIKKSLITAPAQNSTRTRPGHNISLENNSIPPLLPMHKSVPSSSFINQSKTENNLKRTHPQNTLQVNSEINHRKVSLKTSKTIENIQSECSDKTHDNSINISCSRKLKLNKCKIEPVKKPEFSGRVMSVKKSHLTKQPIINESVQMLPYNNNNNIKESTLINQHEDISPQIKSNRNVISLKNKYILNNCDIPSKKLNQYTNEHTSKLNDNITSSIICSNNTSTTTHKNVHNIEMGQNGTENDYVRPNDTSDVTGANNYNNSTGANINNSTTYNIEDNIAIIDDIITAAKNATIIVDNNASVTTSPTTLGGISTTNTYNTSPTTLRGISTNTYNINRLDTSIDDEEALLLAGADDVDMYDSDDIDEADLLL